MSAMRSDCFRLRIVAFERLLLRRPENALRFDGLSDLIHHFDPEGCRNRGQVREDLSGGIRSEDIEKVASRRIVAVRAGLLEEAQFCLGHGHASSTIQTHTGQAVVVQGWEALNDDSLALPRQQAVI
jgi:hypothetical protein